MIPRNDQFGIVPTTNQYLDDTDSVHMSMVEEQAPHVQTISRKQSAIFDDEDESNEGSIIAKLSKTLGLPT